MAITCLLCGVFRYVNNKQKSAMFAGSKAGVEQFITIIKKNTFS